MKLTVCYFGSFDVNYARNHILIEGLRRNACKVIIVQDRQPGLRHYFNLLVKFLHIGMSSDVIIVAAACFYDVPLAWLLGKLMGKKVIYDAFISTYDTYVNDRKSVAKNSLVARKVFWWEWSVCRLVDVVLIDTVSHRQYFIDTFDVRPAKIKVVLIGADDQFFTPMKKAASKNFIVEFHGSFQPLQGVDFIVGAANLLKSIRDIKFIIAGEGQDKKKVVQLAKKLKLGNIKFLPSINLEQVKGLIIESDVCLGIFGTSDKAARVIPNKGYESIAMKKPLITLDSRGARELFINKSNAILISNSDPKFLAEAIVYLKENPSQSKKIAQEGYELFNSLLTPKILGYQLKKICQ